MYVFTDSDFEKSDFAYVFSYISTTVAWYIMRYKRKRIARLLYYVKDVNIILYEKPINTLVAINCAMPMIITAAMIYIVGDPEILRYYVASYDFNESWITIAFMCMEICVYYMVLPSANNIMSLFYTSLCWGCSVHINKLTKKIEQFSPEEFGLSEQIEILKSKKKMDDVLHHIQNEFSEQFFFTILAGVFTCSFVAGGLLTNDFGEHPVVTQLDYMYYLINSISCIALTLWIVGRIPIEMKKFHHTFYERTQERLLRCYSSMTELQLKIDFLNEPDFVMTGCDILPLRRSTILALIGTLFTYTVLFMSLS
ncbi:uncharacterized protein NPIL_605531 [Nephila pilipes]|uniref:Uncharacterized protein n=1 Tax=Nephila pilipes TaxID=299642 RepID=A0A8X6NAA3_NEPPI|nr:uncharacterized protein NPIL_605531 [Nephila pilipes]